MQERVSRIDGEDGRETSERRSRQYEPPAFVVASLLDLVLTGGSVVQDNRTAGTLQG